MEDAENWDMIKRQYPVGTEVEYLGHRMVVTAIGFDAIDNDDSVMEISFEYFDLKGVIRQTFYRSEHLKLFGTAIKKVLQ